MATIGGGSAKAKQPRTPYSPCTMVAHVKIDAVSKPDRRRLQGPEMPFVKPPSISPCMGRTRLLITCLVAKNYLLLITFYLLLITNY